MMALDFPLIVQKLADFRFPEVDSIVGIGKSGIIPAALVAYQLGKDMKSIYINFRDEDNQPCREQPALLGSFSAPKKGERILVVDDVSVSGQTLRLAKSFFKGCDVKTFVLKGQADYVLFPDIKDCVAWPWKQFTKS